MSAIKYGTTAAGVCFCFALLIGCQVHERRIDKARTEDLRRLADIYFASTNIRNTKELIAEAESKGVTLHSPIAKDPLLPSYRLVREGARSENGIVAPNDVLIEETNIRDGEGKFAITVDRTVQMRGTRR
jgi:hypothetical protein